MSTLYKKYIEKVIPELKGLDQISNTMMIPKIDKVVINRGMGKEVSNNSKVIEETYNSFFLISGQKPVLTYAKKSISNFKLREGQVVGCKVTMRSKKMYAFLTKLFYVVAPRIRDFRGFPNGSFDGNGNYTFGLKEDSIFPEVDTDRVVTMRGLDITICTNTTDDKLARKLLEDLGFPFRK